MKNHLKSAIYVGLFLIPFTPFLVSSAFFFPFITTKAFAFRAIVEIIFAAWVLLALLVPEYRPKKTRLFWATLIFTGLVLIADLLGVSPMRSLWSNFERMEGFVLIAHMLGLFLIMASVFREADWKRWWNTSLVAAFLMVLYCALQLLGVKTINQGGVRVDGTFGNAIYLAVYMLFHIFIALFYLTREWKKRNMRWLYGLSMVSNALILYFTATRGTILGLLGGLGIFALLNLRNRENPWARKSAIAIVAVVIILAGSSFALRKAAFVEKSPVLSRFATISLSEVKTQGRYYIWPMALKGIGERPILGWGQDNFGYVFQKYYDPAMYNLEPWFDRAHNVFLDWAVAGGLVTLALYLSFYFFALDIIWRKGRFTYLEKSVLTSLIAAYFFHNLFVFDHLYSYVLFFSLLAYLESRTEGKLLAEKPVSSKRVSAVAAPAVAVLLLVGLYFLVWKPLLANTSLIDGLIGAQSKEPAQAIAAFEKSYAASSEGHQEEVEQMVTAAPALLSSSLPLDQRNAFYAFLTGAVRAEAASSTDARTELAAGMFFVQTGSVDEGLRYLQRAQELSPNKQETYFQIASADITKGDAKDALAYLKAAYDLAPGYSRAKTLYLVGAIYANDRALEAKLLPTFGEHDLAFDDTILSAYYVNKRIPEVLALLEARKALDPANAATYDSYIKQVSGK